jgi:hypothetical protein
LKVNFLIIGSAKSATTSLSNGLALHPDICFSLPKEPQFFSKTDWRHQIPEYHALFTSKAKLYGEGSTNYTKFPSFNKQIYADIFEYNPKMKLIYIMRHPIDRIVSHYTHTYNRGYEPLKDINKAITLNEHYINTSKYATQIEPYIEQFGRAQILLLFFEDFVNRPQEVLDTVYTFLEVDQLDIDISQINKNKSFNRRVLHYTYDNPKTIWKKFKKVGLIIKNYFNRDFIDSQPQLTEATKQHIVNGVTDDIHRIEKLTNKDLSKWLKL